MRQLLHALLAACFAGSAPVLATVPDAFEQAAAKTVVGKASGVVLVARKGKILWQAGVGSNSCATSLHVGDAFDALSIGKTFTAVALQRLADQHQVDLHASIRRYIPELPASLNAVTVKDALDNASGWGAYLNEKGDFDPESEKELLRDLATAERPRQIGQYGYSNTGFQALGLVVQRASGKPFKTAIRDLVFRPAGLTHTDFLGQPSWHKRPVVVGCVDGKRTGSVRAWPSSWSLLGAAGIGTTAADLFRLNRFITRGGLSASARSRMLADGVTTHGASPYHDPSRTNITYGSGFYHWRDAAGRRVHYHGGDGNYGFHDAMFWREDDDIFVVGLFNSGDPGKDFDRASFVNAFVAAAEAAKP